MSQYYLLPFGSLLHMAFFAFLSQSTHILAEKLPVIKSNHPSGVNGLILCSGSAKETGKINPSITSYTRLI
jgi:hypothetical protein